MSARQTRLRAFRVAAVAVLIVATTIGGAVPTYATWQDEPSVGATRVSEIVVDDSIATASSSAIGNSGYTWRREYTHGGYFDPTLGIVHASFANLTPPPPQWTGITQRTLDGPGGTLAQAQ